ncbi:hypothetical protein FRC18_011705 [Serendipita sp. 400]|nr:hypothetical protein FRC18_011705 [Serendipita sp. 400]
MLLLPVRGYSFGSDGICCRQAQLSPALHCQLSLSVQAQAGRQAQSCAWPVFDFIEISALALVLLASVLPQIPFRPPISIPGSVAAAANKQQNKPDNQKSKYRYFANIYRQQEKDI